MTLGSIFGSALTDFRDGFARWRVWVALASEDISDQHRLTTLGPLWLLLNYLAFAGTFILVFGRGDGVVHYETYVAVGLFVWFYLSEAITQSVSLFVREESFIKGTALPLTVYVLRLTMQSVIRAGYMLVGCLLLLTLFGTAISISWTWSLLGMAIIIATTPAAITVFATMGAFFPDMQYVVQNIMRLGMFLTPIFWTVGTDDGIRRALADFNPFSYYLDLVREPILTGHVPLFSYGICVAIGIALWAIALFLLGQFRKQIVFVV